MVAHKGRATSLAGHALPTGGRFIRLRGRRCRALPLPFFVVSLTHLLFLGPFPSCDPTTGTRLWPTPTRKPGTRCSCGGRRPGSWNRRCQGDGRAGGLPQAGGDGGPGGAFQPGKDIGVLHGEGAEVHMAVGDPKPWGSSDCPRL